MQSEIWEDERPTYYLEVKKTTRDFSEQFYMSGSQYRRVSSTKKNPKINVANQKTMTDAKNAATATGRSLKSLRHFSSFQPRGKNWDSEYIQILSPPDGMENWNSMLTLGL
jgi:hypothetical protein